MPMRVGEPVRYFEPGPPVEEGEEREMYERAAIITRIDDAAAQLVTLAVFVPRVGTQMPSQIGFSALPAPDSWTWLEEVT